MSNLRMSVGRDNVSATRCQYCIFDGDKIVAREAGFRDCRAARRAGLKAANRLQVQAEAAKPRGVPPIAPAMLARIMDDPEAAGLPDTRERDAELVALRLASPKRANAGKPIEQQQDAAHLPLFVHANEPSLF